MAPDKRANCRTEKNPHSPIFADKVLTASALPHIQPVADGVSQHLEQEMAGDVRRTEVNFEWVVQKLESPEIILSGDAGTKPNQGNDNSANEHGRA